MEKGKEKETCTYAEKLLPEEKARYLEKCRVYINGIDPYGLKERDYQKDYHLLPPTDYSKLLRYLVLGVSRYTLDEFLCYKSLEAHMNFTDGWVHDLHMLFVPESENTIIRAKVS